MTKEPYVRLYADTGLQVWEEHVDELAFRRRVFDPVIRFLRRGGWRIRRDPDVHKNHRCISKSYKRGTKGDLILRLETTGRVFDLEMWQDRYGVTHRCGGRYESNKRALMPYVLRCQCDLELLRLAEHLRDALSYPLIDDRHLGESAAARIDRLLGERQNWQPGQPYPAYFDRWSRDRDLVEHGATVWTRDAKGRLRRGRAHFNGGNTWGVRYAPDQLDWCMHSNQLHTRCPEHPRRKANGELRHQRLQAAFAAAIARRDFGHALQIHAQQVAPTHEGELFLFRKGGSWWRPKGGGYTNTVMGAGLFSKEEADRVRGGETEVIPLSEHRDEILALLANGLNVAAAALQVSR
jgi:hypothetical protein